MNPPEDDDILDLTDLSDEPPERPAQPAGRPTEAPLPMTSQGSCPACGFALAPLETICRRCRHDSRQPVARKPVAAPQPTSTDVPLPVPQAMVAQPRRGRGWQVLGIFLLVFSVLATVPALIWMQPAQRARREYQKGLEVQLKGDFEVAREHYLKALEFDPQMGLAAFSIGTTHLRMGAPGTVQSMQDLEQKAVAGDTKALDSADKWFRKTLEIAKEMPPNLRLMDQRIDTPARLQGFAHALLGLTALIRASAALQGDEEQLDNGMAWLKVVGDEAQAAMGSDPGNPLADQILKAASPRM
jgi:hypothetical protein